MQAKRMTAAEVQQYAATKPVPIIKGQRNIRQNIKFSLDRLKAVPRTAGTGLCNSKEQK